MSGRFSVTTRITRAAPIRRLFWEELSLVSQSFYDIVVVVPVCIFDLPICFLDIDDFPLSILFINSVTNLDRRFQLAEGISLSECFGLLLAFGGNVAGIEIGP